MEHQHHREKLRHILITILAITGLCLAPMQNALALVAADNDGFDTGGDPPIHSWTNNLNPNPHTRIFDGSGGPVSPLVGIVYNETDCTGPNGFSPPISVCRRQIMARQLHIVARNYVRAFMLMTQQFTAVMMKQALIVGSFIDADLQMDTQREIQTLVAKAHKDYHPSEQLCRFGTFTRSVADTHQRVYNNKQGFNAVLMTEYLNTKDSPTGEGFAQSLVSRQENYKRIYCNPADNGGALEEFCTNPGNNHKRYNKDINYQDTLESRLTINVDFSKRNAINISEDEEDMISLARNLYWPQSMDTIIEDEIEDKGDKYANFRNLVAVTNVAHNSFAHIMSMKARAEEVPEDEEEEKGWYFMKQLMNDLGVTDVNEVDKMLGEYPSYYAQMEVLTKKIYQDPDFYTNLYDKPENVRRISASLDAVKLMQGRDRFEAALRREMLISSLLEQAIDQNMSEVNARLKEAK